MIKRKKQGKNNENIARDDNKTSMFFHVLRVFLCF